MSDLRENADAFSHTEQSERATTTNDFNGVELPRLLTIKKAADVLGVDSAALMQWIEEGRLQIMRVNGQVRVLTSSIEDRAGQRTTPLSNQEQD